LHLVNNTTEVSRLDRGIANFPSLFWGMSHL